MSETKNDMITRLIKQIHAGDDLSTILPKVKDAVLHALGAQGFIVYERKSSGEAIASIYATAALAGETRIPLSTHTIPGIVALAQKPLAIKDVHNAEALTKIHHNLKYDASFEKGAGLKIKSMLAAPIKPGAVTLGVIQVFNKKGGGVFSKQDVKIATGIGEAIGEKFQVELKATKAPYEHLIQTGRLTAMELDKYERSAKKTGVSVPGVLMKSAGISIEEIGISLERFYLTPFMAFDTYVRIPGELVENIKNSYMISNCWVPVSGDRDKAFVLIDDPTDVHRVMEVESLLGAKHLTFMVGIPEDIVRFIERSPRSEPGEKRGPAVILEDDTPVDEKNGAGIMTIGKQATGKKGGDDIGKDVIQLVDKIIALGVKSGASDIHLQTAKGDSDSIVRFRIDGACRQAMKIPSDKARSVAARIKIMAKLDIAERRKPQDGKCYCTSDNKPLELRVATVPTVNGENVVLRILTTSKPLPVAKLNMSNRNMKETINIVSHPHGIFLVVGPTGSGKTTTLHAVLGHINTPERVIWTAEDPVEITQEGLNQVQMHTKIGLDFASALRSFLRADPDVIMIGEMRDNETAQIGVEASLTGHLVMSTLHTNSAADTIIRLLDFGIDSINFSDALLGILAQRLVRTLCPKCKKSYDANQEEYQLLRKYYGDNHFDELGVKNDGLKLYVSSGCEECGGTGYKGRTGLHELLVATPEIKDMIYKKAGVSQIHDLAVSQGMRTIMQDGIVKVLKGQTDITQVRKVAV